MHYALKEDAPSAALVHFLPRCAHAPFRNGSAAVAEEGDGIDASTRSGRTRSNEITDPLGAVAQHFIAPWSTE